MTRSAPNPLLLIVLGALSGAAGTVAMDAVWYWRFRRGGGTQNPLAWEFSSTAPGWDKAPAPARVGKLIFQRLSGRPVSERHIALANNVMHWAYGLSWGGVFGIAAGSARRHHLACGLPLAVAVWANG